MNQPDWKLIATTPMHIKRSLLNCTAILHLALSITQAGAEDLNVLMIGNSQCPLLVSNHLIENPAASDKAAPAIKITACIKDGATLKKLWDARGAHYTAEGTAIQSKQVAAAIMPLLP